VQEENVGVQEAIALSWTQLIPTDKLIHLFFTFYFLHPIITSFIP